MPRIPTRTTPYETPNRQHRHFKNKRDQILKALGKSSYINGSQFAIVWVSARGETETYASPVLRSLLSPQAGQPGLFGPDLLEKIKQAARRAKFNNESSVSKSSESLEVCHNDALSRKRKSLSPSSGHAQLINFTTRASFDSPQALGPVGEESKENVPLRANSRSCPNFLSSVQDEKSVDSSSSSTSSIMSPSPIIKSYSSSERLDGNIYHGIKKSCPNEQKFLEARMLEKDALTGSTDNPFIAVHSISSPKSNQLGNSMHSDAVNADAAQSKPDTLINIMSCPSDAQGKFVPKQILSGNQDTRYPLRIFKPLPLRPAPRVKDTKEISFSSPQAISAFLEGKFGQLQQNICKLVCKAWIKVVEPKKQTKFPYRGGDDRKPEWWPNDVRHKEPDHLAKPERLRLMLAILSSGQVQLAKLEMASAEQAAHIPQDKMEILRDIYIVAKEKERIKATWPDDVFRPFKVRLSGLDAEIQYASSHSASQQEGRPFASSTALFHERKVQSISNLNPNSLSPQIESRNTRSGTSSYPINTNTSFSCQQTNPITLNFGSKLLFPKHSETMLTPVWKGDSGNISSGTFAQVPALTQANLHSAPAILNKINDQPQEYPSHFSYFVPNPTCGQHPFRGQQEPIPPGHPGRLRPASFDNLDPNVEAMTGAIGNGYGTGEAIDFSQWRGNIEPIFSPNVPLPYNPFLPVNLSGPPTGSSSITQAQPLASLSMCADETSQQDHHSILSRSSGASENFQPKLTSSANIYNSDYASIPLHLPSSNSHSQNPYQNHYKLDRQPSNDCLQDIEPWTATDQVCLSMMGASHEKSRTHSLISDCPTISQYVSSAFVSFGGVAQDHGFAFPSFNPAAFLIPPSVGSQSSISDPPPSTPTKNIDSQDLGSPTSQIIA